MDNLRKIALDALVKVENGGFTTIVLDHALKASQLSAEDKSLAAALFYGTAERKLTLEYQLNKHLKKPLSGLPVFVSQALMMGAYQILYLEKIPPFAAVNESVNLVSKSKFSGFKGLVNAVLRNLIRHGAQPVPEHDLSITYSVDKSIADALVRDYGIDTAKEILDSTLCRPEIYVRKNTVKSGDFDAEATDLEYCYVIKGAVESTPGYKNGWFYVQDKSSQICCKFVDAQREDRILDCCAAPGGKSFTLAQRAKQVVSCDIHESRVKLISDGAKRLGIENIIAMVNDASVYRASLGEFDKVLCDVPCSGLGVMRRKPDIKYKKLEQIKALHSIQTEIINTASRYVKQGGALIYSTCTLLKAENERIVETFASCHEDFELLEMKTLLPSDHVTDGFFMAKLIRR